MNNSRFKLYLIITLVLSGLLPITGSTFLHFFLLDRYWIDEPLHSIFEALGSFTALSLAILILILQKDKRIPSCYMWVSCALIGMGILDGFHAFSSPGDSFVWLHGMAVLVGGFLFAMVWLPDRLVRSRPTSALHTVVAVVTVILGVFVVYSPDTLPVMINEGVFTSVADTINTLGGFFFLSAAVYFVIRYRSNHNHEDFLFVNFCLLNGWAGLLFPFSQIWHPDWWFWHVLRLAAYLIVLSYMFITFQRSEETLRKEKDKAREYLDIAGVMIVVIDPDQKVTLANKRCCEILGYREDEIIGRNWFNTFIPEGIRSEVKATFAKLMTGEIAPVEFFENPILTKSNEKRLIAWHNTVLIDKAGNIICTLSSGEDITERKLAEEQLLERERSYRTLSENLPGIVYRVFIRENNRMQFFNNTVQPMTGFTAEELMAGDVCSLDPLISSEDRAHVITTVKRAIMDNGPFQVEYRLKHKEGAIRYFLERGRPINGADGNPLYIDGVIFDITESKRAEEQIREQAELLDKAQDAISLWDLEHRLIYWNKGAVRLYGWTAKETIGKNADELLYKEESPQFIEAKKSVIEKGEWSGELRHVTKDSKEVIVESRWTLVRDSKGEPKSILVINTDITEKKKLEAQFLRAQRLESIGTLAGGVAHDINNVLTPIMLSLQLLQEKFTDNESQKLLNVLERSTQRGASLVKQVQSFARGVEGERVALQVSHLISEITQIAKETFPRSIEIRTDISKDLKTISGDATQLHQVIMNLCVNARDAMPDGGILSISAENLLIDENYARMNIDAKIGQYVLITVSDTGTGIPPKIMDRIFDPFFTTKQPDKGTGLGLSTSLAIVKSHGGFINVYSEIGKGTVFNVYLPVVKTTEVQKVDEQLELPIGHGELILVVDDETMVREITSSILETHGYRVLTANDGTEGIKVYTQNREKIKVVLMDMMMPVMDGQECIKALHKVNPDIKIIAVSGLAEKGRLTKVAVTHVKAFLPKPYVAKRLLKTIHEVISAK